MTQNALHTRGWTLDDWRAAYAGGAEPGGLIGGVMAALDIHDPAWISIADAAQIASQLADLAVRRAAGNDLPLYGIPFAAKDNLDAAGFLTTAACPDFAYAAARDSHVVAKLRGAGAILVGKANLDQFATGLVGTRSPYGAVPNTFDPDYVCGGSSSGSASVVARGLVPFSLGTDTAGSGRVPAGFNNIVGLKPTRGWLSTSGLAPACRTLDCVSVFALTVDDAAEVNAIAAGYDAGDSYSRPAPAQAAPAMPDAPRLAIPDSLEFFGDGQMAHLFDDALQRLQNLGAVIASIDFTPFRELANLLYAGPWVAERTLAMEGLLDSRPGSIDPVVRQIAEGGLGFSAIDYFRAEYRRADLARGIHDMLAGFDALVAPTTPTIRTIAEIAAHPVAYNSQFGIYTNFTNLADLCALAVPGGFRADGLPGGITFLAPAWRDDALAALGRRWQRATNLPLGATGRPFPARDI